MAASQPTLLAQAAPAQAVTPRPALPPHKSEQPGRRDKRDRDQPAEGERGHSTDLTV
jgi:hypothetical protein